MRNHELFKKIYGSLLGGTIGDAFGIRVEMMHYLDIQEQYGAVTHSDYLSSSSHFQTTTNYQARSNVFIGVYPKVHVHSCNMTMLHLLVN